MSEKQSYGLSIERDARDGAAPALPYRPCDPKSYAPKIGLIGCGGITEHHLAAYRSAGYDIVALCDVVEQRAEARRQTFYPEAKITTDYRTVLDRPDIEVVDIATHPHERAAIIEAALRAGKHVLSQKPFVENLDDGLRLADLADSQGVKLAVNQNGRWAPHFSYMRHAVSANLIGKLATVDCAVHWDHNWTADTPFNDVRHLILYDFGIHWFDIVTVFFAPRKPLRVYAAVERAPGQRAAPPLIAHAAIEWEGGQATLSFNGNCLYGQSDSTMLVGANGALHSTGPSLLHQTVSLHTESGEAQPALEGSWFPGGFHGTMGELLCAIEEDREPANSARSNLDSLALCFAAAASADRGKPVSPGEVRPMPQ